METRFTKVMAALALLAVVMLAAGCRKPAVETVPKVAVVEDSVVVSHDRALLYAKVTDDGGAEITGNGFCLGKPDGTSDTLFCDGDGSLFSLEVTGLLPAKDYTCKAFAVNKAGWGFSENFGFTTLNDPVPVVKTYVPTDVTVTTAVVTGRVASDGGQTVTERGVCYGTDEHPTINDIKVASGSGLGNFTCQLTGLSPLTVYYVRAYAVCTEGVYYGEERFLVTDCTPLEVRTVSVSDVTATRVKVKGDVVRDDCHEVLECGLCWGMEHLPTIEVNRVKVGKGLGEFEGYLSVFARGVTHYVRAYAINEEGIIYGEELEFVPDDPFSPWPQGTSPGLFSVGEDHQVRFSQGNLQYNACYNVWRFAERQWDFVGGDCWDYELDTITMGTVYKDGVKCDNTLVYGNYDGWVDLFGWGTSGWNNGNIYFRPYDYVSHIYDCAFYGPPGDYDLTGDYAQSDWGVYNTISNGGSRQWRTLTADEINYLLNERVTESRMRFAKAVVAGVKGLIVLPDDWSSSTYRFWSVNWNVDYTANIITGASWLDVLEPAGAVFLPAAGLRSQYSGYSSVYYSNDGAGCYWTVTQGTGVDYASAMFFYGNEGGSYYQYFISNLFYRCDGISVRLVSDE